MTSEAKTNPPSDNEIPVLEFGNNDLGLEIERNGVEASKDAAASVDLLSSGGGFDLSFGIEEESLPAIAATPVIEEEKNEEKNKEEFVLDGLSEAMGISTEEPLETSPPIAMEEDNIPKDLQDDLEMFNSTRSGFIVPKDLLSSEIEFNPIADSALSTTDSKPVTPTTIENAGLEIDASEFSLDDNEDFSVDLSSKDEPAKSEPSINFTANADLTQKTQVQISRDDNEVEENTPPSHDAAETEENNSPDVHVASHVTDVRVDIELQATMRQMRDERELLLKDLKDYKGKTRDLEQDNLTLKSTLDESKIEISILRKRFVVEIEDIKYRLAMSEDKKLLADEKTKALAAQKEKLEQKVRIDLNLVKQREKELESKLELMSMDVDAQVQSRDQKILELRRKIDSLEFNMENVSIREQKTSDDKRKIEDKLNKIMKTLRNSIKTLEDDIEIDKAPLRESASGKSK